LQPEARPVIAPEGDDQCLRIRLFEFPCILTQLRHVVAAGQSTQVTQEHQQNDLAVLPRLSERQGVTVYRNQSEVGGDVTDPQHKDLS